MKIAHLVSTFPPYHGGIGNIAYHYARELALLGHEIEVFTPNYDEGARALDRENRFKVHRLGSWLKYGNAALVPQLLWKLSSFDIIHLHYPFFGGAEWTLFLPWIFVKPPKIILSYHMDVIGDGVLKLFFKGYAKTVLPVLINQSSAILSATQDYSDSSAISRYMTRKPVKVIPYGVSNLFQPKERNEKLAGRLNLSSSDSVILFVGGLDRAHYFKGVNLLIEAVAKLKRPGIKLLIVGNGDLIPVYRDQVRKREMQNQVAFITGVTDQELPDYYNLADMTILPSINRSEAFGLVLLEAMACWKPVIGSSLPGVRAVIEDRKNGLLFQPGDSEDLKEKIQFILDHRETGERYGLSGFKKVEEHFRWTPIVGQVEKAYQEVIAKQPA
ncbi:MAG: glycosyltransferase family 4 protein [Nitrospirae bacterium]|nr:glycosyltransferase family 4 protein [Nitrospirota bacterium]